MKRGQRHRLLGFTIIEAVLSIGLMAFGLLGVIYAFHGMGTSSVLADQTVVATNIARGAIDKIIAKRDTSGYSSALTAITNGNFSESPVANYPPYTLSVTAYEVDPDKDGGLDDYLDASPGSGFARVTITVSWNSGANTATLVTLIANY
ncbi:MAG: hypothetical protein COV45_00125 [Deltaproteobacteria bacterium CG11_big_fil_rev_8_21_14_0_20_47_16]|nr:MAG: hypothetical protein COV45_00125 [Deltaproteobacteria bacterium CG11_big_fil_rev_8_21_14_0_20_47_16]